MAQVNALPISLGGTGECNLADAQAALGITPGGGSPGGSSGQLQFNNGGAFGGVVGSSWDGTNFQLDQSSGTGYIGLLTNLSELYLPGSGVGAGPVLLDALGTQGIIIDATGTDIGGTGTGPINLTSAGGISSIDNSTQGIVIQENGTGSIAFNQTDAGTSLTLFDNGHVTMSATGSDYFDVVNSVATIASQGEIDLNAPTLKINGSAGVSGSGTTMTNVTVVNGIITAAIFA